MLQTFIVIRRDLRAGNVFDLRICLLCSGLGVRGECLGLDGVRGGSLGLDSSGGKSYTGSTNEL